MTQIKRLFSVILYFNGFRFVCVWGLRTSLYIYIYIYCGFTPSGMCYNVCSTVRKKFIGFLLFRVPTRFCDVPSLLAATHHHHSWSTATAQHSAAMQQWRRPKVLSLLSIKQQKLFSTIITKRKIRTSKSDERQLFRWLNCAFPPAAFDVTYSFALIRHAFLLDSIAKKLLHLQFSVSNFIEIVIICILFLFVTLCAVWLLLLRFVSVFLLLYNCWCSLARNSFLGRIIITIGTISQYLIGFVGKMSLLSFFSTFPPLSPLWVRLTAVHLNSIFFHQIKTVTHSKRNGIFTEIFLLIYLNFNQNN